MVRVESDRINPEKLYAGWWKSLYSRNFLTNQGFFRLTTQHMFSVVIQSTKQNIISSLGYQAKQSSSNMGSIDRGMKTELTQYSHRRSNIGPYADDLDVDVIIVGGGFGMH